MKIEVTQADREEATTFLFVAFPTRSTFEVGEVEHLARFRAWTLGRARAALMAPVPE